MSDVHKFILGLIIMLGFIGGTLFIGYNLHRDYSTGTYRFLN